MAVSNPSSLQFADTVMEVNGDGQQLRYPTVHGYRIGEEIGGGGFSKYMTSILPKSDLADSQSIQSSQ